MKVPKNPTNRTRPEVVEKVQHVHQTYHLGPIRIVWYLALYHVIKISDAGVYRIPTRNAISPLRRGTGLCKLYVSPIPLAPNDLARKTGR